MAAEDGWPLGLPRNIDTGNLFKKKLKKKKKKYIEFDGLRFPTHKNYDTLIIERNGKKTKIKYG